MGGFGSGGIVGGKSKGGGFGSGGIVHHPDAPDRPHHGSGGIGGFFGSVGHWVGQKASLAGHDIKAMPGGLVEGVKATAPVFDGQVFGDIIGGHPGRAVHDVRGAEKFYKGMAKSTVETVRHPLRDPFATALTVAPGVGAVGRVGEAGVAASEAARAGEGGLEVARAAGRKLVEHGGQPTRTLHVGEKPVTMLGSRNAGVRLAQRGYDRMVQGALDREASGRPSGRVAGRVAKHGMKRAAGALAEEERIGQRMRAAPANLLDRAAVKLSRTPGKSGSRLHQAALELTSVQTPAEEAAAYHFEQARKGVNPRQNMRVAKLYEEVAKRDLVRVDESRAAGEKVYINPAHGKLAKADAALARAQSRGDTILAEHGVMTPEELAQRRNAPARVRAGAEYEQPTPGKLGIPSDELQRTRRYAGRLERLNERAQERVQRLDLTAADRKRVGELHHPVDAVALRDELRPLEKRLRQLTDEWNAPAKTGGQMTEAEAHARLAELDKVYSELVDKTVPLVSPYARETNLYGKTFDREQLRRNTLGGKGGKHGKMLSVKEEERQLAEAKIHELIEKHPDHPTFAKAGEIVREREHLQELLNQRGSAAIFGETPLPLPAAPEGGSSPYAQRAALHRTLRKGTAAQRAVSEFAHEAGTEAHVHGLDELRQQAEDLTDRINELRGKPGEEIKALRREVARIRGEIREAEAPRSRLMGGERPHVITPAGDIVRPVGALRADRIGAALSVAKDRLQQLEEQAARRVKPTGLVGGAGARPGRGFVTERVSEKRLSRSEASSSRGQVVGEARSPIDKKSYTGRALEQGFRPKDVTGSASRHLRQILRFVNTDAIRRHALETGSEVRRSPRDILVRVPGETAEELNAHMRQILGQEKSTVDTAEELDRHAEAAATQQGLAAAHRMFINHILDRADASKLAETGEPAPKGYRWVDENLIRGLQQEAQARNGVGATAGRIVDSANSAVTALTVYFKVGHIGTRVLTNAATNLIQGSLKPLDVARSYRMWDSLSEEEQARALGASGQHGFAALPHDAENLVGRAASRGAQWWARHADAMFRFNSLAYELRKADVKTPAEFRRALDALETSGHGLPAHEWSKISAAARRADRAAISYDRLNEFERRFLTRGVWFYPWIKGSTLFTVRTMLEHPYKAALGAQAGVQGRERQLRELGDVPSYEQGLVSLGGGERPLTTDLSTFSPFATAADVLEAPAEPGAAAGFFNPVLGASGQYAYGLNQYEAPSTTPLTDSLLALGAPTPEQQIAEAFARRGQDQSDRMFEKTPGSTLLRYLIGPATPRRVNKSALAKAAARERSGRR